MRPLQDMHIRRKLALVILATTAIAVTLACFGLTAFAHYSFRKTLIRDMTVITDVVSNTMQAAVVFQDDLEAMRMLKALESEAQVAGGCIYNAAGRQLATYRRKERVRFPSTPPADGARFEARSLILVRPIMLHHKRVGTIYLEVELWEIDRRLRIFMIAGLVALLTSIAIAAVIATRMQGTISGPISSLANTARRITSQRDFGVRASAAGKDEVGQLTDAFNQMLSVIEERETALEESNVHLQSQIGERERVESRAQAQLARLELLQRVTRAIAQRQDLPSIFQVVVRTLEDDLSLQFACVALHDSVDSRLTVNTVGLHSAALAHEMGLTQHSTIDVDDCLRRCIAGETVYEPDTSIIGCTFVQRMARAGLLSVVMAPLAVENRTFGVVVAARRGIDAFSAPECVFLRQLSEHVAVAVNQVQLHGALKQAYDDLRQTQLTVMQQERLRALGQMASGIAHDINNAMFPVTLYADFLLQKEPDLSARTRRYLTTILSAAGDVAQTVNRMGEFYRQRDASSLARLSLNRIVEEALNLTHARWYDMPMQRGVVIETRTELSPDVLDISGIDSELREALTNLIFNAVDAMPNGGTLTLRTGNVPAPEGAKAQVFLEVSDTGAGMDEATRRRCLEPFFTTKGERGTGLGLAMVYGIMERHGADIAIDSAVGKGTTFRLVFDVPSTVAPEKTILTDYEIPTGLRLLVVDDDPVLSRTLREILESDGHLITTADGGQNGIDMFRHAHEQGEIFDVVITDLGMPHIDGRNVADAVKTMSPTTPVVLLTGWGQRLSAEGELPPHVDYLIGKPPKLTDVRLALAQCCLLKK